MHAENNYQAAGDSIPDAISGQMFGKPCYKINGKAFICLFGNAMVFKLPEPVRSRALSLPDSCLFDPSGKGRAMKEWIQVPDTQAGIWQELAQAAADYIRTV